jgi:hypothetical protein
MLKHKRSLTEVIFYTLNKYLHTMYVCVHNVCLHNMYLLPEWVFTYLHNMYIHNGYKPAYIICMYPLCTHVLGPMLWFLKYFRQKNWRKNWRFWLKTKLNYEKNLNITLVFEKNAILFVENCQKLQKIVIITSVHCVPSLDVVQRVRPEHRGADPGATVPEEDPPFPAKDRAAVAEKSGSGPAAPGMYVCMYVCTFGLEVMFHSRVSNLAPGWPDEFVKNSPKV